MPPPTLPDELLEEVFLCLPPDEPALLVRTSLASKFWLGLLTGAAFHGRYREFHGAPPMLGFFYCRPPYPDSPEKETEPVFLSTTKFSPRVFDHQSWRYPMPLDCRHGRVVIGDQVGIPTRKLTVSDPMTGCWWDLGAPMFFESYGAAVLCAVIGCDHRACHDGPFRVIFVGLDHKLHAGTTVASVWLSSPETECTEPSSDFQLSEWGKAISGFHIEADPYIQPTCPILVEDALHFMLVYADDDDRAGILKYDLSSNCLSLIDTPLHVVDTSGTTILMEMKDGSLGFAYVDELTLYLSSRQPGSHGVASWTKSGRDIIFVNTGLGIYEINLKKLRWKKIWKKEKIRTLVPYMSFYNPQEL
ncbi:unnamed protein product [Alopecurus aequalis]